jgi:hypothetical protein
MAKTHYATVERATEDTIHDEWGRTLCGLEYTESNLTNDINMVSCKKCKKLYSKFVKEMQEAMKHF